MSHKTISAGTVGLLLMSLLAAAGCTSYGPHLMGVWTGFPVPMSPYFQDQLEDNAHMKEYYERVPILGPITEGPHVALDPPSDDEIMRALEKARPVEGGIPFLHQVQRNNVRIVKEPIADYVDETRNYPLIGPAQLHHAHYKCIIYFSEKTRIGWPIPHTIEDEDAQEVIYIDHNHFHLVGNVDGGPGSAY